MSAVQCITVHYSALQCITVHYSALQCITVHYSALQCITVHYSALQCSTVQYSTAQYSTQHSTAQHSTAQHSTAQHSTAQHSTAQHSTAQYGGLPEESVIINNDQPFHARPVVDTGQDGMRLGTVTYTWNMLCNQHPTYSSCDLLPSNSCQTIKQWLSKHWAFVHITTYGLLTSEGCLCIYELRKGKVWQDKTGIGKLRWGEEIA